MSDKSMMFELWTECNSRCKFCYLGAYNRNTSDEDKLYNLDRVSSIISKTFTADLEQYKAAGFIGGEFFQGQLNTPEIKVKFFTCVIYLLSIIKFIIIYIIIFFIKRIKL